MPNETNATLFEHPVHDEIRFNLLRLVPVFLQKWSHALQNVSMEDDVLTKLNVPVLPGGAVKIVKKVSSDIFMSVDI